MAKVYKLTREKFEELKKELEYIKKTREKEVAELIKEARSFGDLSENSEYDEAKTEQGKLYSKIAEIKNLIENAEIVTKSEETDKVGIGSRVTVLDIEFDEEVEYTLVSSQEVNPVENKLSDDSPFGKAVVGHRVGDTVEVDAPAGKLSFKILKIEK
ncbi:MAG: transcription elongation factor GreA [Oscillospiraceae bacterium]|nr:transcription elongation factor GreA [Oscillospiraceae bacterium]